MSSEVTISRAPLVFFSSDKYVAVIGAAMYSLTASMLALILLVCILVTLAVTRLLSQTLLCGTPSAFTLELPPFRRPEIGRVLVRSLLDRTLSVLGRAIIVAAPAGLIIWLMANLTVGEYSLLTHTANFLDPFARLIGMDGIILLAFILGFPANEIVIPLIVMGYSANTSLQTLPTLAQIQVLFLANGWTLTTAVCVVVFILFHWPCSTTLLTIQKETGSCKWTLLAAILPTVIGILLCCAINLVASII